MMQKFLLIIDVVTASILEWLGSDLWQTNTRLLCLATIYDDQVSRIIDRTVSQTDVTLSETILMDPACSDLRAAIEGVPALLTKLQERSTVLQTTVVESLQWQGRYLCLANTHLYFHPDAGHVRLLQGAASIRHIQAVCQPYHEQVMHDVGWW